MGFYYSASAMWAHRLVDWYDAYMPDMPDPRIGQPAWPTLRDLLSRMDRPVAKDIAEGRTSVKPKSPADELAAGIAFWTVACKESSFRRSPDRQYALAQIWLKKASMDCDEVGKSYARLADAYCLLKDADAGPMAGGGDWTSKQLGDRKRCMAALKQVYEDFYNTAPERSLRAASEVWIMYAQEDKMTDADHWANLVRDRFPQLKGWRCYLSGGR
jgi:hypothetical protein